MFNIVDPQIQLYSEQASSPATALLERIDRETHRDVLMPRMLSGHHQGRVLSLISNMIKPQNILEIGTFTGYSALCLAEGLTENGKLITIDINEELQDRVQGYFDDSDYANQIQYLIGNAMEIIPSINETFDLVFIDADKINYSHYYNLVLDKVNKGGFIIADNVLWSGKITQAFTDKKLDKDTQALHDFNRMVTQDERVENTIFTIRDGLLVIRKK